MLDKLKSKVGLNKKKVITDNASDISSGNDDINEYGHKHSVKHSNDSCNVNKKGNKQSTSGKLSSSKESDINDNNEYIGQGVLAGRENNSETELAVDSPKRSHPDSDSVDSVDGSPFAVPKAPPPRPTRKKPAVVVSPGSSRPAPVIDGRDRSRSRSPKRSPSVGRSPSSGSHSLPLGLGYVPKPPRSPRSSRAK